MPPKKKQTSIAKKIAFVGIPLILLQAGYIAFYGASGSITPRESIDKALTKVQDYDERRKTMLRIQLAIADYTSRNEGRSPVSLNELVPVYFDSLPLDPATRKPFAYKVEGGKTLLGYDVPSQSKTKPKTTAISLTNPSAADAAAATAEQISFIYDPTGKRDPFRPFNYSPKNINSNGLTPLEKYDYGQLKLTAVLEGMDETQAIVENQVGRGFTVKKGTRIGLNGGEVIEIQKDKLLILETTVDFTGEKKNRTIELKLRTKDQERTDDFQG